ncbi:YbaY family lipoprotein [Dickeya chrysanthemi]|uniref:YbaY family lipoprotein n=1 Tax=Dickeya chrysanthemi TaxID=556 RepID=UPI0025A22E21|nr:YbaY family lipoprotein [Dickeya chrysanthemi]WJM85998.1 YbaY family lipoprotein [Dickeya chrysanthemi]
MRLWHIFSGITVSIALSGCVNSHSVSSELTAPAMGQAQALSQPVSGMPAVTGTVNIRQKIALPPDSVLTVTVSDASIPDAPSKVISQRVIRTEGQQAPFQFLLPYNPADIRPDARILLSASIAINNRVTLITERVMPVVSNGVNSADLTLVPVPAVPVPTKPAGFLTPGASAASDEASGSSVQLY